AAEEQVTASAPRRREHRREATVEPRPLELAVGGLGERDVGELVGGAVAVVVQPVTGGLHRLVPGAVRGRRAGRLEGARHASMGGAAADAEKALAGVVVAERSAVGEAIDHAIAVVVAAVA